MIQLTPALTNYLTHLLSRLELYKKTDIPELDQKQRNALHSIRSKVKTLVDGEVPLSTACPLTSALIQVWLARQQEILDNTDILASPPETHQQRRTSQVKLEQDKALNELEDRAFYKILNDKTTKMKLQDIKELFEMVNEVCETLKDQQAEVRKLKASGRNVVNDHNLISTLRQLTTEDLAGPSVSGRVWVDCVINQINAEQTDTPPLSPLLNNRAMDPKEAADTPASLVKPVKTLANENTTTIYENVVSFESGQDHFNSVNENIVFPEDDLFACATVVRPTGRRARVKFNTQKEIQETALLGGLTQDLGSAPPAASVPEGNKSFAGARDPENRSGTRIGQLAKSGRRMSINTRFQASMDQISDELRGLSEW